MDLLMMSLLTMPWDYHWLLQMRDLPICPWFGMWWWWIDAKLNSWWRGFRSSRIIGWGWMNLYGAWPSQENRFHRVQRRFNLKLRIRFKEAGRNLLTIHFSWFYKCLNSLTKFYWGGRWESNPLEPDPQSGAWPFCHAHHEHEGVWLQQTILMLVPAAGIEPATLGSSDQCSTDWAKRAKCDLNQNCTTNDTMNPVKIFARPAGLEPATYGFGDRCSTIWTIDAC